METKFTKGKWEIRSYYSKLESTIHTDKKRICEVKSFSINTYQGKYFCADPSIEERQANALLISKAPEMFEMLVNVLKENHCTPDLDKQIEQLLKEATEL